MKVKVPEAVILPSLFLFIYLSVVSFLSPIQDLSNPRKELINVEVGQKDDASIVWQKESCVYGTNLAWGETAFSQEAQQRIKANSDSS